MNKLRVSGKFNNLPKEIMFDILSRVPTESVLECKLVCKPWRDVVKHPSFSQLHLNHLIDSSSDDDDSGKLTCIFLCHVQEDVAEIYYSEYDENNCHETPFKTKTKISLTPPFHEYYLVGSSNGLICCASFDKDTYGAIYVCNPITRESIMLPTTSNRHCWAWGSGFGYSHSTNEYKVVRVESVEDSNFGILKVYTLGSGTGWRNAGTNAGTMDMENFTGDVGFANGALHWVDCEVTGILVFNMADEKCSKIPLPPPCLTRDGVHGTQLGVLGDFLKVTYHYDVDADELFNGPIKCFAGDREIWLLKKNKDNNDFSWSKEFTLDRHKSLPFELTNSGRLLLHGHNKISSYNPRAPSAPMEANFGKTIFQVIRHKNTLVSLKGLGEKDTKQWNAVKEQVQVRRQ